MDDTTSISSSTPTAPGVTPSKLASFEEMREKILMMTSDSSDNSDSENDSENEDNEIVEISSKVAARLEKLHSKVRESNPSLMILSTIKTIKKQLMARKDVTILGSAANRLVYSVEVPYVPATVLGLFMATHGDGSLVWVRSVDLLSALRQYSNFVADCDDLSSEMPSLIRSSRHKLQVLVQPYYGNHYYEDRQFEPSKPIELELTFLANCSGLDSIRSLGLATNQPMIAPLCSEGAKLCVGGVTYQGAQASSLSGKMKKPKRNAYEKEEQKKIKQVLTKDIITVYRCRRCRKLLFSEHDTESHTLMDLQQYGDKQERKAIEQSKAKQNRLAEKYEDRQRKLAQKKMKRALDNDDSDDDDRVSDSEGWYDDEDDDGDDDDDDDNLEEGEDYDEEDEYIGVGVGDGNANEQGQELVDIPNDRATVSAMQQFSEMAISSEGKSQASHYSEKLDEDDSFVNKPGLYIKPVFRGKNTQKNLMPSVARTAQPNTLDSDKKKKKKKNQLWDDVSSLSKDSANSFQLKQSQCTSYFLTTSRTISTLSPFSEMEGNIVCPSCDLRCGQYNWSGAQCACGQWVIPAMQIPKSKVDAAELDMKNILSVPKIKESDVNIESINNKNDTTFTSTSTSTSISTSASTNNDSNTKSQETLESTESVSSPTLNSEPLASSVPTPASASTSTPAPAAVPAPTRGFGIGVRRLAAVKPPPRKTAVQNSNTTEPSDQQTK